ncbi:MAG TPA: TolC family protein [Bacteroidota bacterium]|jgi:outer membrane protein TolC
MNKIISTLLVHALAALLHPNLLSAQPARALTIDEAIGIGLENSKSLHSSSMRVQAADSRSGEAHASQLPTLRAAANYTRLSDVPPFVATIPQGAFGTNFPPQEISFPLSQTILNNYGLRLTVQQPLFTGMRLSSGSDIAEYTAQATGEDYNRDKSDLIYNIQGAYWNLYKAIKFKTVIDTNVAQVKAHLRNVQNLAAQGIVTKDEVLRVDVQLSNAELTQLSSGNNVRLASIALCNLIGLPLTNEVSPVSEVQLRPNGAGELDSLVRQAVEARPEIKGMEYRVKASESAVTLARSGWFPQIYLTGNYYYARPNQRIVPAVDEFRDTWDVGISASFDIWNWGATMHQTSEAQARLSEANDGLSQLKDAIHLEVTQSYLSMNESRERIALAEKGVTEARESYRITNEKFKSGVALNSDLLDAEAALLQAGWNHIQALVDHELAQARLQRAVGGAR